MSTHGPVVSHSRVTRSPFYRVNDRKSWLGLIVGVALCAAGWLSGCTTRSGNGGTFQIVSTQAVDGIQNRAYKKRVLTSLSSGFPAAMFPTGGTAPVTCEVIAGSLPAGLSIVADSIPNTDCFIEGTPIGPVGTYLFTIQGVDASNPPRTGEAILTITIRSEFTVTLSATPAAVQGRPYGLTPKVPPSLKTNLSTTAAPVVTTGHTIPVGNGPLPTDGCVVTSTPTNPGLTISRDPTNTTCLLTSTAVSATGTFALVLGATDNPIVDPETNEIAVPARTVNAAATALNVAAPLKVIAANSISAAPPAAVEGRTYGIGAGFTPLAYTASGGLPSVDSSAMYTLTAAASTGSGVTCTVVSITATCSGTVTTSNPITISATADDSDPGNTATPSGSQSNTAGILGPTTITVYPPLTIDPNFPPPDAVSGRPYGAPQGSSDLIYAPNPGTGLPTSPSAYVLTGVGFPKGITCTPNSTPALICNSGNNPVVGASSTGTVTVKDAANASTPAATSGTDPLSQRSDLLVVRPEMVLTNKVLVNGLLNHSYVQTLSGTGGLPGSRSFTKSSGALPPPTSVSTNPDTGADPLTGQISGTLNQASNSGSDFTFALTMVDASNQTTPSCLTAGTCPGPREFVVNVFNPLAYVVESNAVVVLPFATDALSAKPPISVTNADCLDGRIRCFPNEIAISPNGRYAYLTDPGSQDLSVIDTISNSLARASISVHCLACSLDPASVYIGPAELNTSVSFADPGPAPNTMTPFVPVISIFDDGSAQLIADGEDPAAAGVSTKIAEPGSSSCTVCDTDGSITISADGQVAYWDDGGAVDAVDYASVASPPVNAAQVDVFTCPDMFDCFEPGLNGLSADPRNAFIYVASSAYDTIAVIQTLNNTQVQLFALPAGCVGADVTRPTPDGNQLYVTCSSSGAVAVLDVSNVAQPSSLIAGAQIIDISALCTAPLAAPVGLQFNPDGTRAFVVCSGYEANVVVVLDTTHKAPVVIGTIPLDFNALADEVDVIPNPVLHFTTGPALPNVTANANYAAYVVANGGIRVNIGVAVNYGFAITSTNLPAGCIFDDSTGKLTIPANTLTPSRTYSLTVTVTDNGVPPQSATATFSITAQ